MYIYLCRNRHKEPQRSGEVENKLYLLSIEDHLCKETQQVNCRYTAGILPCEHCDGGGCVEQSIYIHGMTHARTENISHHHHTSLYILCAEQPNVIRSNGTTCAVCLRAIQIQIYLYYYYVRVVENTQIVMRKK